MPAERYSALVLMRSSGGGDTDESRKFTAATIGDTLPDPAAVERTRQFSIARGFEVGPLVGISFSISAPREKMKLQFEDFERSLKAGAEVSISGLPPEIRGVIRAVATEKRPDFGPGSP